MAITYRPSAYDKNLQRWVAGDFEYQEHVGRVFSISSREYRAMSDVYTIASYAMIVKDDGSLEEIMVHSGFEGDTKNGRAVVDVGAEAEALIAGYRAKMAPVWEAQRLAREAEKAAAKKKADDAEAYRIANKPVTGTKMIVVRGRKVKVGTIGVVAFISNNTGGVLLKDEKVWKDRKANGVWVEPTYLEVFNAEKHAKLLSPAPEKKVIKRGRQLQANALGKDTIMKTMVFTSNQENACADALAEDAARDFLTGCAKDVLYTSSYLVVGWGRVFVQRKIVPQFEVQCSGETLLVGLDGRLPTHPPALCVLDDILDALLALYQARHDNYTVS